MGKHRKKSKHLLNNNARRQSLLPNSPEASHSFQSAAFSTPPRKNAIMTSPFSIDEPSSFRDSPSYIAQQKAQSRKAAENALKQRFITSTMVAPGAAAADATYAKLNSQFNDTPKKDHKEKGNKKQGNTPFTNKLLDIKDASSKKPHSKPTLDLQGLKELQAKQHSTPKNNSNIKSTDEAQNKSAKSSHKKKKDKAKHGDGAGNDAKTAQVSGSAKSLNNPAPASPLKTSSTEFGKSQQHKVAESSHKKKKKKDNAKSVENEGESTKVVEKSGHSEAPATPLEPFRSKTTEDKSTTAKKHKSKDSGHKKEKKKKKKKDKDKERTDESTKVTAESATVQVPATPTDSSHAKNPAPVNSSKDRAAQASNKKERKKSKKNRHAKDGAAGGGGSASADAPATASKTKDKQVEAASVAERDKSAGTPREGSKKSSKQAKKRAEVPVSEIIAPPTKTTEKENGDDSSKKQAGDSNEVGQHAVTTKSAKSGTEKVADGKSDESEESSSSESDSDAEEGATTEKSDAPEKVGTSAEAGSAEEDNAIEEVEIPAQAKGVSSSSESDAHDESEVGPVGKAGKEMSKKPRKEKVAAEFKSAERVTSSSAPGSSGSESEKEPREASKTASAGVSDGEDNSGTAEVPDHTTAFMDALKDLSDADEELLEEGGDDDDNEDDDDAAAGSSPARPPTTEQANSAANPRKRKRDDSSAATSTVASRNPLPDPSLFPTAKVAAAGIETANPSKKRKKSHTHAPAIPTPPPPMPGFRGNPYPRILLEQMNAVESIIDDYKYKGDEEVDTSIRLIALLHNAKGTILKLAERKIVSSDVPGATMQMQLARIARERQAEVALLRSQVWELMEEQNVKKRGKTGR